jgi:hypothetical protein
MISRNQLNQNKNIIKQSVLNSYFNVKPLNPLDNFLIFADPRGGSTWLTSILKQLLSSPILWEPLYLRESKQFEQLGFGWRQYIPEDHKWQEANDAFLELFAGHNQNQWLNSKNTFYEMLTAKQFIIKFCRANALLPYLVSEFNFKYKPIHLVRHPFAVVASQIRYGSWKGKNKFDIPKHQFSDIYIAHSHFLNSLDTTEECLTAWWCLTNNVSFNSPRNNIDWITVNYETLVTNPQLTIKRIFDSWNLEFDISKIDFNKPSFTTRDGSFVGSQLQLSNWKSYLNESKVDKMLKVLNYFDVKEYDQNIEPLIVFN